MAAGVGHVGHLSRAIPIKGPACLANFSNQVHVSTPMHYMGAVMESPLQHFAPGPLSQIGKELALARNPFDQTNLFFLILFIVLL